MADVQMDTLGDMPTDIIGIIWEDTPPGWATVVTDLPNDLFVKVRVARTTDGLAAEAVLVERRDGRAITARDLRTVKIPPAWLLASGMQLVADSRNSRPIAPSGPGARRKGDEHWRAVFQLWSKAQQVAPHAPVRWMREQWPGGLSDASMRRWIKRAQERADVNGWTGEDQRQ
jgi:hypothetical protein